MSLFYDRDRNITGVDLLTGFTFDPIYGSTANFSTKSNFIAYSDKVPNISPLGINSIVGEFGLSFQLRESDAQKLINFYESQSGTGVFSITDNSNIYKTLSGTIDSLGSLDSSNNQKYSVNLKFNVERNASVLNWSGQSFVNHEFKRWDTGIAYNSYDIVYFENDLEDPLFNFFYCTGEHFSSFENHPLSTGQKWTQNLFLDTNDQFSIQQTPFVSRNEFEDSFTQRINEQQNVHSFDELEISYKNISDKKTKALLHFVESRLGVKRFEYQLPEIYNRPKIYFAPTWSHQWNYKDSNNLRISAREDPFGVITSGSPSASLVQNSGIANLTIGFSGTDRLFFDTGDGKKLLTGTTKTFNWSETVSKKQIKLWGGLSSLSVTGQNLTKAQLSSNRNLNQLNLSNNNIGVLNLYGAPNLNSIICSNNSIKGFDLGGKPNLSYIDINNNQATYLNIGGTSITGLKATGNAITSVCLDSSLSGIVKSNIYSGYVNFSGNSGVSESSLSYISTLTGRGWTIGYEYTPLPTTTTILPSTTTMAPVSGYPMTVFYGSDYDACNGFTEVDILLNASTLASGTVVNFATSEAVKSGEMSFSLSDQTDYYRFTKVCCSIAVRDGFGACNIATSTEEPTTTIEPTEEPTTTPEVTTLAPTTPSPTTTLPP